MRNIYMYFLLVFAVGLFGCEKSNPEAEASAMEVARAWLVLVDEERYSESWQEAAGLMKGMVTEDQWLNTMRTIRQPFGKIARRDIKAIQYYTSLPGAPDGQYVMIKFKSFFENDGKAVETVLPMLEKDGTWRVSSYYMNY